MRIILKFFRRFKKEDEISKKLQANRPETRAFTGGGYVTGEAPKMPAPPMPIKDVWEDELSRLLNDRKYLRTVVEKRRSRKPEINHIASEKQINDLIEHANELPSTDFSMHPLLEDFDQSVKFRKTLETHILDLDSKNSLKRKKEVTYNERPNMRLEDETVDTSGILGIGDVQATELPTVKGDSWGFKYGE